MMPAGNVFYESLMRACKRAEAASGGRLVLKANPADAICPLLESSRVLTEGLGFWTDVLCIPRTNGQQQASSPPNRGMSPMETLVWMYEVEGKS